MARFRLKPGMPVPLSVTNTLRASTCVLLFEAADQVLDHDDACPCVKLLRLNARLEEVV